MSMTSSPPPSAPVEDWQALFDTRAVALADGVAILGIGLAFMAVLEVEKLLLRRWKVFAEIS